MSQSLLTRKEVKRLLVREVDRCGSQKQLANEVGFKTPNPISLTLSDAQPPSDAILRMLGLEKVTYYRRTKGRR